MMDTISISCQLDTTDASAELGFEAWIDNTKFFDSEHVQQGHTVATDISDQDAQHELRFVMKNKTSEHTKVDDHGNIVSDARLIIADLKFDGIDLGAIFSDQAIYQHDFNGHGQITQQKFFKEMGCNGTVSLKFSTPVHLWLLEHI